MFSDSNKNKECDELTSRTLVIALGSNLGDSKSIFSSAIEEMAKRIPHSEFKVSSFIETEPVDCPAGSPPFLNGVVSMKWYPDCPLSEAVETLLTTLQAIEVSAGRTPKKILNEARPLDLDIIDVEGYQHKSKRLVIPHPRACQRNFVLEPLKEILPGYEVGKGFMA